MNKKNRYTEALRLFEEDTIIKVGADKLDTPNNLINKGFGVYCPYLYFSRTLKSSPGDKKQESYDRVHQASGEAFNIKTMRNIIKTFKEYLAYWKPSLISHSAYRDNTDLFEKRMKLYETQLNKLGYVKIYEEFDEWEDEPIYFYERRDI